MSSDRIEIAQICGELVGTYINAEGWLKEAIASELKNTELIELRRLKNEMNRLRLAALSRPTIAVFGQSQVGKSYLTSNLVKAPSASDLLINDPGSGQKISFIKDMNPYGGKESTGTVTRFTASPCAKKDAGFKVKLLTPKDLVCIILNGYFLDIKQHNNTLLAETFSQVITALQHAKKKEPTGIFSPDDFHDIKRYVVKTLGLGNQIIIDTLNSFDFWNQAAEIAPYLDIDEATQLSQIIWGGQEFLSQLFKRLLVGLKKVNYSTFVHVPKEALTPNTKTILDVERVRELYIDTDQQDDTPLKVILENDGTGYLDRRILAALTAEVEVPLSLDVSNEQNRVFLQEADVLDFPGARSREHIPETVFIANTVEAKLQLFIRGKVAYLFDLYNQDFGISTLLYCMHNDNPEVQNIPSLLYNWIRSVIGENQSERSLQLDNIRSLLGTKSSVSEISPLLVVLTKSDVELTGKSAEVSGQPHTHDGKWVARLEENFKNFMIRPLSDKWVENWTDQKKHFNHVFPLRNPDFSRAFFTADGAGKEIEISASYEQKLADMKMSFLQHDAVKKHIIDPAITWDSFATPNQTGIEYIIQYLTPSSNPMIKLALLKGAAKKINDKVYQLLYEHYDNDNPEEKIKQANIKGGKAFLYLNLLISQNNKFGSLLDKFLLKEEEAWSSYFKIQNQAGQAAKDDTPSPIPDASQLPLSFVGLLESAGIDISAEPEAIIEQLQSTLNLSREDLESTVEGVVGQSLNDLFKISPEEERISKDLAMIYTEEIIAKWINNVSRLKPNNNAGKDQTLSIVIDELIKTRERIDLRSILYHAVKEEFDNFSVNRNIDIVARITTQVINNFINTFGWYYVDEQKRPTDKDQKAIFSESIIDPTTVVPSIDKAFPGERIASHWRIASREAILKNAYIENNVNNPNAIQLNQQLGDILNKVKEKGDEV